MGSSGVPIFQCEVTEIIPKPKCEFKNLGFHVSPFLQNVPMVKQMQPRNSNLRELPVAPGNAGMNSGPPASNARPVAKATPGLRPGQSAQPFPVGGRGRGHVAAKPEMQPGAEGGGAFRKEAQSTQPSTAPQVSLRVSSKNCQ